MLHIARRCATPLNLPGGRSRSTAQRTGVFLKIQRLADLLFILAGTVNRQERVASGVRANFEAVPGPAENSRTARFRCSRSKGQGSCLACGQDSLLPVGPRGQLPFRRGLADRKRRGQDSICRSRGLECPGLRGELNPDFLRRNPGEVGVAGVQSSVSDGQPDRSGLDVADRELPLAIGPDRIASRRRARGYPNDRASGRTQAPTTGRPR